MQIQTFDQLAFYLAGSLGIDVNAAKLALDSYISQLETLDNQPIDRDNLTRDNVQALTEAMHSAQNAGDLGSEYLRLLEEKHAEITHQEDKLDDLRTERNDLIADALKDGARAKDIAQCAGVSLPWVYGIRKEIQ